MKIALSLLGLISFICQSIYFDYLFQLASYQIETYRKRNNLTLKLVQNIQIFGIIPILFIFWTNFELIFDIILTIIYTASTIIYFGLLCKKKKVKLVFTSRMARLTVAELFILLLAFSLFYNIDVRLLYSFYLFPLYFVPVCNLVVFPIEHAIANKYIKAAQTKLNKVKPLVIGITGSFGKTSIKNYLVYLLSGLNVYCSPLSYNTPLGISKTIHSMPNETKILVLEYGARRKGDIKKLLKLFPCQIGVLTGINNQHIEFFKSQNNIINEKCELIKHLNKYNYPLFLNADTGFLTEIMSFVDTNIYVSCSNSFNDLKKYKYINKIYFSDRNIEHKTLPFPIKVEEFSQNIGFFEKTDEILTEFNLLGDYNYSAIALAVSVARYLNVSDDVIKNRITHIRSVKHRLEVINSGGKYIIDDAYNSNESGFKEALNSLKYFSGKKVLVTSGVVELGKDAYKVNYALCSNALKVVDVIIFIGKVNKKAFHDACVKENLSSKILYFDELSHAVKIFPSLNADVMLFENDLPDNYR